MTSSGPLRVCVAGAGAIGCTLAARLGVGGQPVNVLARGKTLAALQQNGIRLSDLGGEHQVVVNASANAADFGVQDIVFVSTKAQSLASIAPSLAPLVGEQTVVVPMVNGVPWWYFHAEGGRFAGQPVNAVDPDGVLAKALPLEQVIGCVVFITAQSSLPAEVKSDNPYLLVFGEPSGQMTPRLERLRAMVEAAGIEARGVDRIRDTLWTKILANLTSNPLSVVTGATLEQLYSLPDLKRIVVKMLHEGLAVAAAYGSRVNFDPHTFVELAAGMGPVKTSMLQDYEKGLALELAAIGDAVLELAGRMGIDMPVTRDILGLARFRGQLAATHLLSGAAP